MTKASFQAFCRNYTGTALEAMADAHALCDLQNAASGDIAARLGAISGLPPAVAVQVAWNGTDTDLDTYFNAGVAILRSLGTNAHVWLPGANGVSVASLPSNNYLLSDGSTGYSTVNGVVGLDLDGMGSLGSELVTNGDFSDGLIGWSVLGAWAAVGGQAVKTGAVDGTMYQDILTIGRTYQITIDVVAVNTSIQVYAGSSTIASVVAPVGTKTLYLKCAGDTNFYVQCGSVNTTTIDNISVKEYTGTHLTQPTTANKPLVRRGMLNELLNSATPATQSVTCIAAPYTLALYGTGNVVLSGTGAGTLTGTGASDLVVLNFTPTAGSVTFTKAGTVSSFGLFKGTWTAAQILAEGGIPTTTATAASNPSAGKYWWSFDGSNDSLAVASVPYQVTDDHCVTLVARRETLTSFRDVFSVGGATSTPYLTLIETDNGTTTVYAGWRSDAAVAVTLTSTWAAGEVAVWTMRQVGNTRVLRKNGVQVATNTTALGATTVTQTGIGIAFGGATYFNGAIGWVVPIKATMSDADCLTVERLVSSQFPNGPVF